jgi:hypothetical protein
LIYPANLDAVALSGNAQINNTRLFPSADGNLNLLANGNVNPGGGVQMYEADPGRVANPPSACCFVKQHWNKPDSGVRSVIHLIPPLSLLFLFTSK